MKTPTFKLTKYACFFMFPTLTPVFILPPVLFVIFRQMYGISYTLLGTLVLVNFCVQLGIDLIFSFFSRYFNHQKALRIMPLLTTAGLLIYALIPWFFPQYAYGGLMLGTVIFSFAAGLNEVLLSPTLAALPSENPERDMSILHSLYGYGCAGVAMISTVFLHFCGRENWMYLTLFWAALPLIPFVLFSIAPLPDIAPAPPAAKDSAKRKRTGLLLCMACIFLGSAAENTMSNWVSVYIENALKMPKLWGDTLGLTAFALLLALTRTLYARYGKRIFPVLMAGMVGAVACYLAAGLSHAVWVSVAACMLTGVCTSMLWPGMLLFMEEKFPNPGIAAYALMAAGGDLGASVAPQGLGIVVDAVTAGNWAARISQQTGLSPEQIGIKTGMLTATVFPLLGIVVLLYLRKFFLKKA